MIASNVNIAELEVAAGRANVILNNVAGLNQTGRRIRFTLRPTADKDSEGNRKWQRISAGYGQNERRVFAVCWHGHKAFLEELFALNPKAVVRSGLGGRKVIHAGQVDLDTAWISLGPPINGGYPRACEACSCPWTGTQYTKRLHSLYPV